MVASVSPLVLQGAQNFRDVGGCVALDGKVVRRGLLFRSQGLSALTDNDLSQIAKLDIGLVCDLRSTSERTAEPSRWPTSAPATRLEFDISTDLRGSWRLAERFHNCRTELEAQSLMRECYAKFPAALEQPLRQLFIQISESSARPILIHCSAGKDRTGFAIAIILSALHVSRRAIFEDYLRSASASDNGHMVGLTARALAAMRLDAGMHVIKAVADARVEYLQEAFSAVDNAYGSLDNYLEACGLNRQRMSVLRERLLVS